MNIGTLVKRCIRIFYIAKKPTNSEYWTIAKITSLGMIAIGAFGLILSLILR